MLFQAAVSVCAYGLFAWCISEIEKCVQNRSMERDELACDWIEPSTSAPGVAH